MKAEAADVERELDEADPNGSGSSSKNTSAGTDDGFLNGKRYVLMDRDTKFCQSFRDILKDEGAEPLLLPPRSLNLNAYIERFIKSLKSEALSRMSFFGEKSLRRAVTTFLEHYHAERNPQGLDNQIIDPRDEVGQLDGKIECRERLGGVLKYYHRMRPEVRPVCPLLFCDRRLRQADNCQRADETFCESERCSRSRFDMGS